MSSLHIQSILTACTSKLHVSAAIVCDCCRNMQFLPVRLPETHESFRQPKYFFPRIDKPHFVKLVDEGATSLAAATLTSFR